MPTAKADQMPSTRDDQKEETREKKKKMIVEHIALIYCLPWSDRSVKEGKTLWDKRKNVEDL